MSTVVSWHCAPFQRKDTGVKIPDVITLCFLLSVYCTNLKLKYPVDLNTHTEAFPTPLIAFLSLIVFRLKD